MTGIHFITRENGRKTVAVFDLKKHRALWEDIEDSVVSRSRRHEERLPLEKVKADRIKSGKLRGQLPRRNETPAAASLHPSMGFGRLNV